MDTTDTGIELPRYLRVEQVQPDVDLVQFESDLAAFYEIQETYHIRSLKRACQVLGDTALTVVESLRIPGFEAVRTVAFVNCQPPRKAMHYHTDGKYAIVVHASKDGAFDYAPHAKTKEQAEADFSVLPVMAGDIVYSNNPRLWHRGRNPSDSTRYNLVIQTRFD